MVTADVLKQYPQFAHLSPASLQKLADIAEEHAAPAGETIFTEPDPADYLYLIVDGAIDLAYELGNGQWHVVDTLGNGELMGWCAFVEPYRWAARGTAARETRLIRIGARTLREFCERDHAFGCQLLQQITQMLADRVRTARARVAAA
jgi:CRP/FNR family transcriptional regulator, cyclic AMP receptor protein